MKLAILGLGARGRLVYLNHMSKYSDVDIAALCDIKKDVLETSKQNYAPKARCFDNEKDFFSAGKMADFLVIATQDRDHYRHAMAAMKLGYHLILEKPVTGVETELDEILAYSKEHNRKILVCHVLRYAPFFQKIKEILDSGLIGDVVNIVHQENIGFWHFAHSFVRGNWRDENATSPILLAKTCHDFDLLYWYIGKECTGVSSYGSLNYFTKENQPKGAVSYCLNGCAVKKDCPFDAEKLYCSPFAQTGADQYEVAMGKLNASKKEAREILKISPYGRCVFACDNNVNDHQVVNMQFEGGATATLTLSAFTKNCYRRIHIMGTQGDLHGTDITKTITVNLFGKPSKIFQAKPVATGHGGGDKGFCDTIHQFMQGKEIDENLLTTIDVTARSHKIIYEAVRSSVSKEACV